ncbi:MAG TPA: DoxX-like family protein [Thermoanaerobaculia bacterium]|nr:DoxX-like family protein [Thermoanaerobaculia bacterium]
MSDAAPLLPPPWLIHSAIAAVWLYEGLWCKLLEGDKRQREIVARVPRLGPSFSGPFLKLLGAAEVGIAAWVLSGAHPVAAAAVQTLLLVALNASGLIFARRLIHDPAGMIVKNFAFLVLAWVSASLPHGP